jgi:L-alanine-DL-glutamate epimerase-like enolase superfamily enzyme
VADLAHAFEIPVAMMNCPANFMAHTAAALPNHMMMEMVAVGRDIAMNVDQKVEDGWIVLGDSPGLGIEYDQDKLESLSVDQLSPDTGIGLWGRRRGAGLYEVGSGEPEYMGEE